MASEISVRTSGVSVKTSGFSVMASGISVDAALLDFRSGTTEVSFGYWISVISVMTSEPTGFFGDDFWISVVTSGLSVKTSGVSADAALLDFRSGLQR